MKLIFQNNGLKIYNSVFEYIDSNMFLIVENKKGLIIDPHYNKKIETFLKNNCVEEITVILTHEHTDHTSGIKYLKDKFKTILISTKETSDYLSNPKNAKPILIALVLDEKDRNFGTNLSEKFQKEYKPYISASDITFTEEFEYKWNNRKIKLKAVRGHSEGSCFIFLEDNHFLFSGDSLLKDYPIITRFPRGNKKVYKDITLPYIESLDKNLTVFPGHGESFKLEELFCDNKFIAEIK